MILVGYYYHYYEKWNILGLEYVENQTFFFNTNIQIESC